MIENDLPEQTPDLPPGVECKLWIGPHQFSQPITAMRFGVTTMMSGRKFAVVYFANGKKTIYNLEETPIFTEYAATIKVEQKNLRAAWLTAEDIKNDSLITYEIGYRENGDNKLCRDDGLSSPKTTLPEKIKLITNKLLRPLGEKLHHFISRLKSS